MANKHPESISLSRYLLHLTLDAMLFLFPLLAVIHLIVGDEPAAKDSIWWIRGLCVLGAVISGLRIVTTLFGLISAKSNSLWWLLGALVQLVVLCFVLYSSVWGLMLALGAGVSVGEPMG